MFMESKVYKRYAKARAKKSPLIKNCVCAFLIGGLICTAGQALLNLYKYLGITEDNAGTLTSFSQVSECSTTYQSTRAVELLCR